MNVSPWLVCLFSVPHAQSHLNSKEAVISQFGTGRKNASKSHLRHSWRRLEDTTGPQQLMTIPTPGYRTWNDDGQPKPLHGEAAQAPLGLVASDITARVTTRLGLARVLA